MEPILTEINSEKTYTEDILNLTVIGKIPCLKY